MSKPEPMYVVTAELHNPIGATVEVRSQLMRLSECAMTAGSLQSNKDNPPVGYAPVKSYNIKPAEEVWFGDDADGQAQNKLFNEAAVKVARKNHYVLHNELSWMLIPPGSNYYNVNDEEFTRYLVAEFANEGIIITLVVSDGYTDLTISPYNWECRLVKIVKATWK